MRSPFLIIHIITLLLFTMSCGSNSDQRDFENRAFQPADNFTRSSNNGEVLNEDADDWRVSPFFQGVVEVDPAFPNPVQTGQLVSINVLITGVEAVSGLQAVVFFDRDLIRPIFTESRRPLPTGLIVIPINSSELGRFNTSESARGLKRVILLDANENVISYGDIMVE